MILKFKSSTIKKSLGFKNYDVFSLKI